MISQKADSCQPAVYETEIKMHPYKRSARVSDLIRQEVADIIMNRIKHKTFGFVTVTGAKVSDDLRNATIYISVLDDAEKERTVRKFNSMISFFNNPLTTEGTKREECSCGPKR